MDSLRTLLNSFHTLIMQHSVSKFFSRTRGKQQNIQCSLNPIRTKNSNSCRPISLIGTISQRCVRGIQRKIKSPQHFLHQNSLPTTKQHGSENQHLTTLLVKRVGNVINGSSRKKATGKQLLHKQCSLDKILCTGVIRKFHGNNISLPINDDLLHPRTSKLLHIIQKRLKQYQDKFGRKTQKGVTICLLDLILFNV